MSGRSALGSGTPDASPSPATLVLAKDNAHSAAYRAGEMTGAFVWPLCLALGIVKCFFIARRPTTSASCVHALTLVLTGWLAVSTGVLVAQLSSETGVGMAVAVLGSLFGLLCVVAGVVVAIVGLASYTSHPEYVQGKRQAVTALMAAGLMLALGLAGMVFSVWKFAEADLGRQAVAKRGRPFGRFRSPTYPYSVEIAGNEWQAWPEATKKNSNAEVGGLLGESSGFLIAPFALPGEAHVDAVGQAVMKDWDIEFPSAAVTGVTALEQGGLRGYAFGFERTVSETRYVYRAQILSDRQWGLLALVWTAKGAGDVAALARPVFAGIRIEPRAAAIDVAAQPLERRQHHATLCNRIGLFYFNAKDYAASARLFEPAVRWNESDRTLLLNLLRAYSYAGEEKKALAFLARTTHAEKDHHDVRSWHAWFLNRDGQTTAALALYDELFKGPHRDDDDFLVYARLLAGAERFGDLTRAFDAYLKNASSLKLRLEESKLLAAAERHDEAVRMLVAEQQKMPFSTDIAFALIDHYDALEHYRKIVEVCDDLVRHGFDSAAVELSRGEAQVELKWYRAAKESFERALEKKPADAHIEQRLKQVSGLLGEGSNSSIKDAIEAVPLPPALAARLPALADTGDAAGYGARYVYIVDGFRFTKGQASTQTRRQRIAISDSSGVERFSTLEIGFDPLVERVFVNELTVRDAAGAVVARGEAKDFYVTDDKDSGLASHKQTLYLPVPSLQEGRVVDLTYTRRDRGTAPSFSYESFLLSGVRPVSLRAVYYLGDPALIRHRASAAVKQQAIPDGVLWSLEDLPVHPWEPLQATRSHFAPSLVLASAGEQWPELAERYLKDIEGKLALDAPVKALALDLTRGISGREAKIHALLRHAQSGYVYKPIEFGLRARIPNTAAQTLEKKYGDCKDHSVLLRELLQGVGIASHLALVNTSEDVQKELPSLQQFDHMIVYVPDESGSGGVFYDATDKSLSVRANPPMGLGGREALVLDPARPRFESIPACGPDSSRLQVERKVRLVADGRASVSESVELTGYYASSLRTHLKSLEAAQRKGWAQQALAGWLAGSELQSFSAREIKDNEKALALDLVYALPHACERDGSALRCASGPTWERHYLEVEPVNSRRTPFAIEYPLQVTSRTSFEAPEGWKVGSGGAPAHGEDAFGTWSTGSARSGGGLVVSFDAALKRGEFAAERYGAYRELLEQALRSIAQPVRAER